MDSKIIKSLQLCVANFLFDSLHFEDRSWSIVDSNGAESLESNGCILSWNKSLFCEPESADDESQETPSIEINLYVEFKSGSHVPKNLGVNGPGLIPDSWLQDCLARAFFEHATKNPFDLDAARHARSVYLENYPQDESSLFGNQILRSSVLAGSLDSVRYLIEECRLNPADQVGRFSMLHAAAVTANNSHVLQYLIGFGLDLDFVNEHGNTPVHLAAQYGNHGNMLLLLEAGADPDKCDAVGQSLEQMAKEGPVKDVYVSWMAKKAALLAIADMPAGVKP